MGNILHHQKWLTSYCAISGYVDYCDRPTGNADEAEACLSESCISRAEVSCSVYSGTHSDVSATLRDLQQTTTTKNNSPQSLKNFTWPCRSSHSARVSLEPRRTLIKPSISREHLRNNISIYYKTTDRPSLVLSANIQSICALISQHRHLYQH